MVFSHFQKNFFSCCCLSFRYKYWFDWPNYGYCVICMCFAALILFNDEIFWPSLSSFHSDFNPHTFTLENLNFPVNSDNLYTTRQNYLITHIQFEISNIESIFFRKLAFVWPIVNDSSSTLRFPCVSLTNLFTWI